ncbi:MAG TPA: aminotransferase class V-fold PLP-dependent enzyme [Gammaproteobacteria bacterium]|nr:aminotransferase class V-fold PLP-dependent enzyme [Gammaproteobacteria bacterium]
MNLPIYLDYAATTPVDPRVAAKMMQYLMPDGIFANASSTHTLGQAAKNAVDIARAKVAKTIHAEPSQMIWTSGATESNNLALKGASEIYQRKGRHIITLKTEHSSVLDCCQQLEKQGFFVTYLTPSANGLLDLTALRAALREDTILVSIMQVNNETGVIQDINAIAEFTAAEGILLHVDAAQSIGKIHLDVEKTPIDLVSLSAHKVYGPKGIGALYLRRKPRVRVAAQMHGGGHEQGMRSGTLPVHQIVGMGEAFELADDCFAKERNRITELKRYFYAALQARTGAIVNGDFENSVPHILNVRFPGIKTSELINAIPEMAVSTGSACHAKGTEPSYVLRAMGLTAEEAHCSLRFSFGRFTTKEELDDVIDLLPLPPQAFCGIR